MKSVLRSWLVASTFTLAAALPAPAQLLEYSVGTDIVGVNGPAPDFLWGSFVDVRFVFDSDSDPIEVTAVSATYAGLYGVVEFGSGEVHLLFEVMLTITKDPTGPYERYDYIFSGETAEGWEIVHSAYSTGADFVPNLLLPTVSPSWPPEPDGYAAGYVDVIGPDEEWSAFSDSGPWFDVMVVDLDETPSLCVQPASEIAKLGKMAKFTVKALGDALSYQWLKDGVPIVNATSSKLKIKKTTPADAGVYHVIVDGTDGFVISEPAYLTFQW